MDLAEISLRAVGAFYVLAGLVATRAAVMSHFLDRAIAAISLQRTPAVERHLFLWLLGSATLVLAGGAALLLLHHAAAWLFVAAAAGQALHLAILSPRYFDAEDPLDAAGRRQSVNAFVVYCAATAFVLWAAFTGRLLSWREVAWPLLAVLGAAAAAHAVHLARQLLWRTPSPPAGGSGDGD